MYSDGNDLWLLANEDFRGFTSSLRDRDMRIALVLAIAWSVVYISLLSVNPDSNGIVIARAVESGYVASPNHMLFEVLGMVAFRTAGLFGYSGRALPILQILTALCGGTTLAATYLASRGISANRAAAHAATAWFGTTWAFLNWSTNVAYVALAAMMAAIALALTWRIQNLRNGIPAGSMAALSVLAWQANVFILPALLAAIWIQPADKREKVHRSFQMVVAFGLTLGIAYIAAAIHLGIYDFKGFAQWLSGYGGGRLPMWGRWGWPRTMELAQTWIHSAVGWISLWPVWLFSRPIRFDTVCPRLAPFALALFFIGPGVLQPRALKDRIVVWSFIGIGLYLPFLVWWDPFETKWLLVPNLFLALLAARLWSRLDKPKVFQLLALAPVLILFLSNLTLYALPNHTRLSANYAVGDCVGRRLRPADLYIATDWAWGAYMSYTYNRESTDAIGAFALNSFNMEGTLRSLKDTARSTQESGGEVYVTDPAYYGTAADPLTNITGITPADLDKHFPGVVAFGCNGWPLRKLDAIEADLSTLVVDTQHVLELSRREATAGDSYVLRITGLPDSAVSIIYSINGEGSKVFMARLDTRAEARFTISRTTSKGTYRFLAFRRPRDTDWIAADAAITVK